MPDLRDRLEGLAERFPERGGLEGLDRTRRRRQRRGRLLAGSLALLIAAVGAGSVFLAFNLRQSIVVLEPAPVIPDTLRIECDGETAQVLTPEVRVRPDGVHLEATNTASFGVRFSLSLSRGSEGSPSVGAGQTETTTTTQLVPGESDVWCGPERDDVNDGPAEDRVTIVDPEGLYQPENLECGGRSAVGGHFDYGPDAMGEPGPPVEIIKRRYAAILREGDVVDSAGGYPEGPENDSAVRILRNSAVVATFEFTQGAEGTYLQSSYFACSEFNEELNRA